MWRYGLVLLTACGRLNFESAELADDAAGDAPVVTDGPLDAPLDAPTAMLNNKAAVDTALFAYTVTVPTRRGALVVTVHIGSNCAPADLDVPFLDGVVFAGVGMTRIKELVGTPCGPTLTRSEVWLLVDPPAGSADVVIDPNTELPRRHATFEYLST